MRHLMLPEVFDGWKFSPVDQIDGIALSRIAISINMTISGIEIVFDKLCILLNKVMLESFDWICLFFVLLS